MPTRRHHRPKTTLAALFASLLPLLIACTPAASIPALAPVTGTAAPAQSATQNTATPPATPSPQPGTPTPKITPSPPQRTQYRLEASLDYAAKLLQVQENILFLNQTGEVLDELLLVVEPNQEAGLFRLDALRWGDGKAVEGWALKANILHVPLPDPLPRAGRVSLALDYELAIPPWLGVIGHDQRQVHLGNWYPFIPPYQSGLGWLAYQPGLVGEHFSHDMADYSVTLTLAGSGEPLTVAASAQGQISGDSIHYEFPEARSFALSISPEYEVLRQTVQDVEISSYTFPENREAGQAALQASAEALALYSQLFGPYPHASLSIVQADFPDGLEFDGLFFLGDAFYWGYQGGPQNFLTTISAHETAHQWWYGLVGSNQAMEPWLDEALATYSEVLFYERVYPEQVEWWWHFRVNQFRPEEGAVDDTIYQYGSFRPYVNAVYLRGALMLQEIRARMGDEAFFTALGDYAAAHRHGWATGEMFWSVMESHGQGDLTALRTKYFKATGE